MDRGADSARMELTVYTAAEVAALLKVSVRTVQEITHTGKLAHIAIGTGERREARYTPEDIKAYLDSRRRVGRGQEQAVIVPLPKRRVRH